MTASITEMREITDKVRPPRALEVPYDLGYPLGAPNDPALQTAVLRALLPLLERSDVPLVEVFTPPS